MKDKLVPQNKALILSTGINLFDNFTGGVVHWLSITSMQGWEGEWSVTQLSLGKRQGTPWIGHQSDNQPHTQTHHHRHTPQGDLRWPNKVNYGQTDPKLNVLRNTHDIFKGCIDWQPSHKDSRGWRCGMSNNIWHFTTKKSWALRTTRVDWNRHKRNNISSSALIRPNK